jgi:hypothetical protein
MEGIQKLHGGCRQVHDGVLEVQAACWGRKPWRPGRRDLHRRPLLLLAAAAPLLLLLLLLRWLLGC